jgi:hypothetical protein
MIIDAILKEIELITIYLEGACDASIGEPFTVLWHCKEKLEAIIGEIKALDSTYSK